MTGEASSVLGSWEGVVSLAGEESENRKDFNCLVSYSADKVEYMIFYAKNPFSRDRNPLYKTAE